MTAAETLVLAGWRSARPDVGHRYIGSLAECVRAELAAGFDIPGSFVLPHLQVADLEGFASGCLDAGRTGVAVASISNHRDITLINA